MNAPDHVLSRFQRGQLALLLLLAVVVAALFWKQQSIPSFDNPPAARTALAPPAETLPAGMRDPITPPMLPPEVHIAPDSLEMILPAGEEKRSAELPLSAEARLVCTLTNRGPRSMPFNRFHRCWAGIFQRADGTEIRAQGFIVSESAESDPEDFPLLAPGGSAVKTIPCRVGRAGDEVWWVAFDPTSGQCATIIEPGRYRFRLEYHPCCSQETTRPNSVSPGVDLTTIWSGTVPSNWIDLTIVDASKPQ